jgi:hypothetical protein
MTSKQSSVITEQLVQKNLYITQVINRTTGYKLKMVAAITANFPEEQGCNIKDTIQPNVRIFGTKFVRYIEYETKLAKSVIRNY